jgi:hypothetical protein
MKKIIFRTIILILVLILTQSCVLFNITSQNNRLIPTKTYTQAFGKDGPEQYPKISKSFLTPRIYEMCISDFMKQYPTGLFDYYEARKDSRRKLYYFFFSYCFDKGVCYAYDINNDKLVFKVIVSSMLSDEEILSLTNDLDNCSTY